MGNLDQRTLLLVRLKFCEAAARDLQITAPPGGNLQIPVPVAGRSLQTPVPLIASLQTRVAEPESR